MLRTLCIALVVWSSTHASAWSQEAAEEPAPQNSQPSDASENPADEAEGEPATFEELFAQWKEVLARLRELQLEYQAAAPQRMTELENEFNVEVTKGEKLVPRLSKAAEEQYAADPGGNEEVSNFLASAIQSYVRRDQYEDATRVAILLIENNYENEAVYSWAGVAAFAVNDFEKAKEHLSRAEANSALNQTGNRDFAEVDSYIELWKEEQQRRAAEAEADDLPRVLFQTTKGDIVLELFENEAPNAVANFINLIEKGYYDGLTFHRVIRGFMVQGGCPKGDGTGGPGYNIACECYDEGARMHFRGSLSMAHAGRDTGGSQFFITHRPTSHLNDRHTVFGRVLEGFDALTAIGARNPSDIGAGEAERIEKATVLRKRDHEYTPETLPES